MAHVELSLSGTLSGPVPQARTPAEDDFVGNVDRWTLTVASADEPCLVIARDTTILALSKSCGELLGLGGAAIGQRLRDGVLRLIDFTAGRGMLGDPETEKIPPLLALSTRRLARGLMRVQPGDHAADVTVDAISTPLSKNGVVVASLTFFAPVA